MGQKADDEAARKAQEDHTKKFVSRAVLFNPSDIIIGLQRGNKLHKNSVRNQQPNYGLSGIEKHCALTPFRLRESERTRDLFYYGYNKGEHCASMPVVHINEEARESLGSNVTMINNISKTNEPTCMKLPMPLMMIINYYAVSCSNKICMIVKIKLRECRVSISTPSNRSILRKIRCNGND